MTLDLGSGVPMSLTRILPGTFLMGSPDTEKLRHRDEGPQRQVMITRTFYMGICEVTQKQYEVVMGANPSQFRDRPRNPVERVSWNDAVAFCRALSRKTAKTVRLPTEAEWEYACRAGTATPFSTGQTISTDQANYSGYYVYGRGRTGAYRQKTVRVASFKPNAWGLYDMHGNVWEWCSDRQGPYQKADTQGPKGRRPDRGRVLRGGSWFVNPRHCRSAFRYYLRPDVRNHSIGFRVLVESDGVQDPKSGAEGALPG